MHTCTQSECATEAVPSIGNDVDYKFVVRSHLQQIHATEKDIVSAKSLLSVGADFAAAARSDYTRLLFLLSRGMVRLRSRLYLCHLAVFPFGMSDVSALSEISGLSFDSPFSSLLLFFCLDQ